MVAILVTQADHFRFHRNYMGQNIIYSRRR